MSKLKSDGALARRQTLTQCSCRKLNLTPHDSASFIDPIEEILPPFRLAPTSISVFTYRDYRFTYRTFIMFSIFFLEPAPFSVADIFEKVAWKSLSDMFKATLLIYIPTVKKSATELMNFINCSLLLEPASFLPPSIDWISC